MGFCDKIHIRKLCRAESEISNIVNYNLNQYNISDCMTQASVLQDIGF